MYLILATIKKGWYIMVIEKSRQHLKNNNMGYCEHFRFAAGHGLRCIKAGLLLLCHSFIPAFFARTGSKLVRNLSKDFTEHDEKIYKN